MNYRTKSNVRIAAVGAALITAIAVSPRSASAQRSPTSGSQSVPAGQPAPDQNTRLRPLNTIVTAMGRTSGAAIFADSSVSGTPVPPPAEASSPQNFEAQLDAIVKGMPQGTTWAKIYLPVTKSRMDADAVSDYAIAQAKLFGSAGAATPAGMVEIMGQRVPADQAQTVIAALNLKPVYLISNPLLKSAGQNWARLTPDQQKQYAAQQAQQILNMDPAAQQQLIQQQMAVFGSVVQQMTPEQRQQMMQNFGNMRRPGQGNN